MTANQWRLIEDIFLIALERTGDERSHYLKEACRGQAELRREVESLLSHEEDDERVLRCAVSDAASKLAIKRDKYVGSNIGPYHVVRQLSQGGTPTSRDTRTR
jgi:hypothetical protein